MLTAGPRIAYFVSSHGFGHATRACAVMAALREAAPGLQFEIFTQAPAWLFEDSVAGAFALHPLMTDVGLMQAGPLHEDIALTLRYLDEFLPFDPALVARLAGEIRALGCRLVLCDIAPLGLAAAREAGLPSVLIENFTWDWIYGSYVDEEPRLKAHIAYLQSAFALADYRLQTEPAVHAPSAQWRTAPVSRRPRASREAVRARLGMPADAPAVLITMGGIPDAYGFIDRLAACPPFYFVIPGGSETTMTRGNVALLPHHSEFYHPDLIYACDAVIGKAGYSTVAETYQAGLPFGYVPRERFRETGLLASFIQREMAGFEVSGVEFQAGQWLRRLPDLLALPRRQRSGPEGAAQAAALIGRLME